MGSEPRLRGAADRRALYGVFVAGMIYTVWLVASIPDQVFFSGDAGVKALFTQQVSAGVFGTRLVLTASDVVRKAWDQGLYPLRAPFVYPSDGEPTIAFPFLFEYLCAPFFRLLGFRGLYVVPLFSLWLTWATFTGTMRKLDLPYWARIVGLATLIFASHVTLYGATFWEHTLGILLAYFGIDFVATRQIAWSGWRALGAGFLLGLAFLVRSEALLLSLSLCGFVAYASRRQRSTSVARFVLGAVSATAIAMAINWTVYRHPLGAHSRQMLEELSLDHRLRMAADHAVRLAGNLILHVPVVLFVIAILVIKRRSPFDQLGPYGIAIPCALFVAGLPFIVPNSGGKQLGPRYLLIIVPALVLIAAVGLADMQKWAASRRRALLTVFAAGFLAGFLKNSVLNAQNLLADYRRRVVPALELVRAHPATVVIVNDHCVAQELESTFSSKSFILALDQRDVRIALRAAEASGVSPVLFGSVVDGPLPSNMLSPGTFKDRGRFGGFRFLDVDVRNVDGAKALE